MKKLVKLIANDKFAYARRDLTAGDEFEATPDEARILVLAGRARNKQAAIIEMGPPAPKRYSRRDMTAET